MKTTEKLTTPDTFKNVCVVDDYRYKRGRIISYMQDFFPAAAIHSFQYAGDFLAFMRERSKVIAKNPAEWLIVLDMQMPMFKGDEPDGECGYKVLTALQEMRCECPVITASSDVVDYERGKREYDNYHGGIWYDSCSDMTEDFRSVLEIKEG